MNAVDCMRKGKGEKVSVELEKRAWKVAPISYHASERLIKSFHYSKTYSEQAVALHGLFLIQDTYCVLPYGVCWWSAPPTPESAKYVSEDFENVLYLSRMVLSPDAPRNSASFLLSRSIKALPSRYHTLLTYADTWQNHVGTIYKATNWHYDGLTDAKAVYLDETGKMVADRGKTVETMKSLYTFVGKFPKHRFIFYRHIAPPPKKRLDMFGVIE